MWSKVFMMFLPLGINVIEKVLKNKTNSQESREHFLNFLISTSDELTYSAKAKTKYQLQLERLRKMSIKEQ